MSSAAAVARRERAQLDSSGVPWANEEYLEGSLRVALSCPRPASRVARTELSEPHRPRLRAFRCLSVSLPSPFLSLPLCLASGGTESLGGTHWMASSSLFARVCVCECLCVPVAATACQSSRGRP
jgi:hypothetical protein